IISKASRSVRSDCCMRIAWFRSTMNLSILILLSSSRSDSFILLSLNELCRMTYHHTAIVRFYQYRKQGCAIIPAMAFSAAWTITEKEENMQISLPLFPRVHKESIADGIGGNSCNEQEHDDFRQ